MAINLMEPIFDDEMLEAAKNALTNEFFLNGDSIRSFEKEFADYIGVKYARAINSGTTALQLSLLAMGIDKNDEVITTPATFIATSNAIKHTGAKPVFADITFDNYNIDPEEIRKVIKKSQGKVKAIVPVHLYGYPADMSETMEIAEEYDIKVLEDACQGHGGFYKGKKLGSLGDAGAFSFYPSKNMTVAGDGGMVTTNNEELIEKIDMYRNCGRSKKDGNIHDVVGYTARMNTVNAAIGRIQLQRLDKWLQKRIEVVNQYKMELKDLEDIILPPDEPEGIQSAWHLFVIRSNKRDELHKFLRENEIRCGVHYAYPVHLQPAYANDGYSENMLPKSEQWAKEVLSLPVHFKITQEQVSYISEKVLEFFRRI